MTDKDLDSVPIKNDWDMEGTHRPEPQWRGYFNSLRCVCGSRVFKVFDTNSYETAVRCEACGLWEVVHDG